MATEQFFQQAMIQNGFDKENAASLSKWNSLSEQSEEDNSTNNFDCNICLDSVNDPVVTLCGHLYCWPCIYKWIHYQSASTEKQPQCPVCKTEISQETLVPLYGRGQTAKPSSGNAPDVGMFIPKRPPSPRCGAHTSPGPSPGVTPQLNHWTHPQPPQLSQMPLTMSNAFLSPTAQLFGEMVYARIFGNSETLFTYPNSYTVAGMSTARARRQAMEADRSLSRLCFFFLCCLILCLLLF